MMSAMQWWSELNGNVPMLVWAALFAGYLAWRRRYDWALTVAIAVPGIELVNAGVKLLVKRPRPGVDIALATYETYSFPSGHVAVSTVFYGLVAAYVITHARARVVRVPTVVAATSLVALVGLSRVYLGVHYPGDVMGALVEGLLWIGAALALRRRFSLD